MSKHRQASLWRRWHKAVLAAAVVLSTGIVLSGAPATYAQAGKLGDVGQVLEQGGQPAGKDDGDSATAGPGADLPASPSSPPSLSTDLRTPVHRAHMAPAVRTTVAAPAARTAGPAPVVAETPSRGGLLCDVLDMVGVLL